VGIGVFVSDLTVDFVNLCHPIQLSFDDRAFRQSDHSGQLLHFRRVFLFAYRAKTHEGLWLISCFVTPGAFYSPIIVGVAFTVLYFSAKHSYD
jgi:hypothetical protein